MRGSGGIADVLMNGAEGNQDERIRALDVDPRQKERGQAKARNMHVDGDRVERWYKGIGDVERLVREGTEENVVRLFGEFVREVLGENGGMESGLGIGVEQVEKWLGEVFMPVL